jgi:hypothetical protein
MDYGLSRGVEVCGAGNRPVSAAGRGNAQAFKLCPDALRKGNPGSWIWKMATIPENPPAR